MCQRPRSLIAITQSGCPMNSWNQALVFAPPPVLRIWIRWVVVPRYFRHGPPGQGKNKKTTP